ncbi:hypothetical protein N9797_01820 [Gammaproteobacteria bacterium]|nr:hypothetical protein [Gammaproteobacteria bacterium]
MLSKKKVLIAMGSFKDVFSLMESKNNKRNFICINLFGVYTTNQDDSASEKI